MEIKVKKRKTSQRKQNLWKEGFLCPKNFGFVLFERRRLISRATPFDEDRDKLLVKYQLNVNRLFLQIEVELKLYSLDNSIISLLRERF